MPTERPSVVGKVSPNFWGQSVSRGQCKDPYGRILGFLDRSRYFFLQAAPQLYSRYIATAKATRNFVKTIIAYYTFLCAQGWD
jgi:hypothetical protein